MTKLQNNCNLCNILIVIILILAVASIAGLFKVKQMQLESYFNENKKSMDTAFKATIQKYNFFSDHLLKNGIITEKNLSLLDKSINEEDEDERRYYKGMFYRNLWPYYKDLKKYGIRQLHFHLKDNTSFLRFHHVSTFGDDLSIIRPTVSFVNEHKKPISLFETGPVVSGMRNVFPLIYNERYLGSVEISITLKSILDSLEELYVSKEFAFMLNKELINSKIFAIQKHLYTDSLISDNFVQEDSNCVLEDSPKPLSANQIQLNKKLYKNKELQIALSERKPYSTLVNLNEDYYNVSFLPMLGLNKNVEGYLVSYEKVQLLPFSLTKFDWILALIIVVFSFMLIFVLIIKRKSNELQEEKNWFTNISNSLGEGLFVMNKDSIISYINPEACKILGYSKEELIGKNAHSMIHAHHSHTAPPLEQCPILLAVKEFGYISTKEESFRRKDGSEISVELNSKEIYRNKSQQMVTIFQDISVQKALEERMRLLTKALESSANAVIITDNQANIEWANSAFEILTGYKITEVLGKTPKELIKSGKQDQQFYQDMWDTILSKKPWKGEIINKRKDGSLYYEELSITPVLNANKEIQNFISIKQDISDRKENEKNIKHFAYYDHLTDLPNRRLFTNHLKHILKSLDREKKFLAILFLDLDKFKILNDTQGHDAGDELLKIVSQRLLYSLRSQDFVARLGGDEFVVILDDLPNNYEQSLANCVNIAEKLLVSLRKPYELQNCVYHASASIGIYIIDNQNESIDEMIKKSDTALYESKTKGRDTYSIYMEKEK